MGKELGQSPSNPQSHGDFVNESLEPVYGPSGPPVYPYNESQKSSENAVFRRNTSAPPLAGQSSPQKYDISDRPICTPRKIRTMPTMDSPVKNALGSNPSIKANFVKGQRDAIIRDLGSDVPRGSLDYFKKILPPLRPEFNIHEIASHLIKNGDLTQEEGLYVWKEFRKAPTATTLEKEFFNDPLVNVFRAIRDAALETSNINVAPTLDMVTDGYIVPGSVKSNSAKPDGYLVLKETEERVKDLGKGKKRGEGRGKQKKGEKVLWYDIAVSFEFKTKNNPELKSENVQKAMHNMQHVLAVDPSRRFTYGVDIEGTELGLWIATRAMVVACDTFDFRTRYDDLIWIFLSLAFASKEDLGWDTSIKSTLDDANNQRLYDIEIGGEHYCMSESDMISGEKADGLVTSATRVWKAKRDVGGPDVIIKDYWPGDERETEDNIRRMILEDIKDPEKRKFLEEHTLSSITGGRVKCNGEDDHTKNTILRGQSPDMDKKHNIPVAPSQSSQKSKGSNSVRVTPSVAEETKDKKQALSRELERNRRKKYYHRYHYRIVYKEVAVPYYKLRNTDDMITVMIDALKALLYLHEAGWVHRDLSAANLYLYTDPVSQEKRGLIGDLEYAKRVGEGGKHDVRTGTPDYMAIEVALQSYQFRKPQTIGFIKERNKERYFEEKYGKPKNPGKSGIYHNYAHDLESLWWILVWTVFVYEKKLDPTDPTDPTDETSTKREAQQNSHNDLFPGDMDLNVRSSFLKDDNVFEEHMANVSSFFLGQCVIIDLFRVCLLCEYGELEKAVPAPVYSLAPTGIHDFLLTKLLERGIEKGDVVSVFHRPLKRSAEAQDDLQQPDPKRSKTVS